MPRFSTNISTMFLEYDFFDRFKAAKNAGFGAIEIQFPYDIPAGDILAAKEEYDFEITVLNIGVGDLVTGGPGLAAMPGREDQFKEAVDEAAAYAEIVKPLNMNVLAGWPPMDRFNREQCLDVLAANLRLAADTIPTKVLVEAVNTRDRPGYLITTTKEAVEIIDKAGHDNLAIEYDLYHMQIMEGDLIATIDANLDRIGHIQFADTTNRGEPGKGEINYPFVFDAIDKLGWQGWLAAEYTPSKRTEDTLEWLEPYL